MPAMRVCCSTSTSRTPRRSRRSGARSSRAATPSSSRGLPGLARLLETLPRNGGSANGRGNGRGATAPAPAARARPRAARRRRRGDGARQGAPHARPPRGAARPARLGAGRRPGARPAAARAAADARAAGAASPPRCCASTSTARRSPRRCRGCRRPTAARSPTRSSTSPTHEQRVWLRKAIESWRYRQPLTADEQRRLYTRLCEVEAMERYLRRSFLGQKQFSLEGLDVLIPMLDESLELAAAAGRARSCSAWRTAAGSTCSRTRSGCRTSTILREFEGERVDRGRRRRRRGRHRRRQVPPRRARASATPPPARSASPLAANPSHLEAVDPVVEGRTRAEQTDRSAGYGLHDPTVAMPILLHGDAAFAGQGVVAETLNLYALEGYSTGGTLHVITNNQVGFTTDPAEGRSTRYSSDLAKGFDVPIVHVNADDPEAAISAVRLALAYRAPLRPRRRHRPRRLPPLRPQRAGRGRLHAAADGRADRTRTRRCASCTARSSSRRACSAPEEAESARGRGAERRCARRTSGCKASFGRGRSRRSRATSACRARRRGDDRHARPGRPCCARSTSSCCACPTGFTVHPKLARQLERRRDGARRRRDRLGPGRVARVRVAARRRHPDPADRPGHRARHVLAPPPRPARRRDRRALHADPGARRRAARRSRSTTRRCRSTRASASSTATRPRRPRRSSSGRRSSATSPTARRRSSTSSSSSGLAKWKQTSRLTLLLPHGYEGNGPEHSSARLERFLQLAAQENIRIANCTTAAQYFHLLRRQALDPSARPLVVMTPKGLLRLKDAASTLDELAEGAFQPLLDAAVCRQVRGAAARALLREDLLRHRRPRGRERGRRRRGRAASSSSIRSRSRRRAS